MRATLIFLGLLATASIAHAKTWADTGCETALVSAEGGTFTFKRNNAADVVCRIENWPVSQAEAKMACDDGSTRTLLVKDDAEIVFDGVTMVVPTDENGVCD
jgi:hypothetical protein